jgi:hypothetical protein
MRSGSSFLRAVYRERAPVRERMRGDREEECLVDPEEKQVLLITNQAAARKFVGDHVEIAGDVNANAKTLRVESLKLLDKGVAMCSRR